MLLAAIVAIVCLVWSRACHSRQGPNGFPFWLLEKLLFVGIGVAAAMSEAASSSRAVSYLDVQHPNGLTVFVGGVCANLACNVLFRYAGARIVSVTCVLIFATLLVVCALPTAPSKLFYYGKDIRYTGVFSDPNTFGLLCSCALIITIREGAHAYYILVTRTATVRSVSLLFFSALSLYFIVLIVRTYSRGAWLSLACTIIYCALNSYGSFTCAVRAIAVPRKSWVKGLAVLVPLALILASYFYVCGAFDRIATIGSVYDYSWTNRLRAWVLGFQMMIDRPLVGFGWTNAHVYYQGFYLPRFLIDHQAIHRNSVILLGIATGVALPALFGCYIARLLWLPPVGGVSLTARACVCVLAIGMLIEGGLFDWEFCFVFWTVAAIAEAGRGGGAPPNRAGQYPPLLAWRKSNAA